MREFIQQYLLLYKTVSVKGWGTLRIVPVSAVLDFSNRILNAPSFTFEFSVDETEDDSFLNWFAHEREVSMEAAIRQRNIFVHHFAQSIHSIKKIHWLHWGVFELGKDDEVTFVADGADKTLLHAVTAERVIRKGAEHAVRVGEDERTSAEMEVLLHPIEQRKNHLWRLNALILLSIGIILAWYFATNYNLLWNQHTNYHQLQPKHSPILYKKL